MASYFLFGKYSSESFKGMGAGRTEEARQIARYYGGEIHSIYALLGKYDLVIIASFPTVEQLIKTSLSITKKTGIAFTTSEAIEVKDFDRMTEGI